MSHVAIVEERYTKIQAAAERRERERRIIPANNSTKVITDMKLDNIHVASLKSFKSFLAIAKLFGRVHTRQALAGGDDAFCSNFSLIIGNTA